jgi:hypothetical protein
MNPVLLWFTVKRYFAKKKAKKYHDIILKYVDELAARAKNESRSVLFYPEMPNYKSGLFLTLKSLGFNIHNNPDEKYDLKIAWEDKTFREIVAANQDFFADAWNGKCLDISKSYVDEVHQKVFGYSTRLDPQTYVGEMLEKNELNGHHDANIVMGPIDSPKEGYIYQKLINNQVSKYLFEDIRPMYIRGEVPFCYLNYRLKGKRFSAKRYKAELAKPEDVLSKEEIDKIIEMCSLMHVDYAEIDTLRDRNSGKLYVIDINTTAFIYGSGQSLSDKYKVIDTYREMVGKFVG